jgi:hypothetical protein
MPFQKRLDRKPFQNMLDRKPFQKRLERKPLQRRDKPAQRFRRNGFQRNGFG